MEPYRIVLADDHVIFRQGIKQLIDSKPGLKVVGEASNGLELVNLIRSGLKIDMAIVDISMPNLRGIEATHEIKLICPNIKVLLLTMHKSKEYLYNSISAGAQGYLLKEDSEVELFFAIDAIRKGDIFVSKLLTREITEDLSHLHYGGGQLPTDILTPREREVLKLVAEGKSNKEISDLLFICIRTVENHRTNIMNKLKLKKNSDLIRYAILKFYVRIEHVQIDLIGQPSSHEIDKYKTICNTIAHDLKNEFLHIGHSIKEIRDCIPSQGNILEEVDMIERSITYSRMLIQRLSNFLDIGILRKESVDLLILLKETEKFSKPRIPSNIRLLIKIPPKIKKTCISANSEQLMGVLLEFIQNATKALQNSGGTIEIGLENKNAKVSIYVKDDGGGIYEEFRKKVFKEQILNKEGSGLGLYLSHKVISEFGGEIKFSTETGRGTTFTILFPTIGKKRRWSKQNGYVSVEYNEQPSSHKIEKLKTICNAIAHDLKNEFLHIGHSITEIRGCIPKHGDIPEEIEMIERSITYSRMLIQRLSNFLDIGTLRKEPVDLLMLLKETEKFSKPRIPSNIRLLIKIPPKMKNAVILANSEQLMGVLLEFIQNATKALQNSGGTIEIGLENKKEKVFIYVKDDGQGIPGEFRKKVFKEQIPNKEGSGLGLYLSHQVISEFGGEIKFSTGTGRGTTFTIFFHTIEEKKGVDKCP